MPNVNSLDGITEETGAFSGEVQQLSGYTDEEFWFTSSFLFHVPVSP